MTTTQEKCGTIFESGTEVTFNGYYKPQRISDWKFLEEKGNWLKAFNCELTFKVENDKIISSFQNEAYPASVCELSTDIWVYQDNDTKRLELVSKELYHLAAILQHYAGSLIFKK